MSASTPSTSTKTTTSTNLNNGKPVSKHRPSYFTPKVKFSPQEDQNLLLAVQALGTGDWHHVASRVTGRNARQCRERWNNYVNPSLVSAPWTSEEDTLLMAKYEELGARWHTIATFFSTRSTNNVKNRFVTLQRRQKRKNGRRQRRTQHHYRQIEDDESDEEIEDDIDAFNLESAPLHQPQPTASQSPYASSTSDVNSDSDEAVVIAKSDGQPPEDPLSFLDSLKEIDEIFWTTSLEGTNRDWLDVTF